MFVVGNKVSTAQVFHANLERLPRSLSHDLVHLLDIYRLRSHVPVNNKTTVILFVKDGGGLVSMSQPLLMSWIFGCPGDDPHAAAAFARLAQSVRMFWMEEQSERIWKADLFHRLKFQTSVNRSSDPQETKKSKN